MASVADRIHTTADTLSWEDIEFYRANGFVHMTGVLSNDETARYRAAAPRVADADLGVHADSEVFKQLLNV